MKKRVKKWLTLAMAFALILGSINYNPLSAGATEASPIETKNSVTGNEAGDVVPDDLGDIAGDIKTVSGDTVSGDMAFEPVKALMFSMMRNARAGASSTRYYSFSDVTECGGYGNVATVSKAGALVISYTGQYQEIKYSLPAGVDGATITNISFKVSGGSASGLDIKVYADGSQVQESWGSDTITIDDTAAAKLAAASTICCSVRA